MKQLLLLLCVYLMVSIALAHLYYIVVVSSSDGLRLLLCVGFTLNLGPTGTRKPPCPIETQTIIQPNRTKTAKRWYEREIRRTKSLRESRHVRFFLLTRVPDSLPHQGFLLVSFLCHQSKSGGNCRRVMVVTLSQSFVFSFFFFFCQTWRSSTCSFVLMDGTNGLEFCVCLCAI